ARSVPHDGVCASSDMTVACASDLQQRSHGVQRGRGAGRAGKRGKVAFLSQGIEWSPHIRGQQRRGTPLLEGLSGGRTKPPGHQQGVSIMIKRDALTLSLCLFPSVAFADAVNFVSSGSDEEVIAAVNAFR